MPRRGETSDLGAKLREFEGRITNIERWFADVTGTGAERVITRMIEMERRQFDNLQKVNAQMQRLRNYIDNSVDNGTYAARQAMQIDVAKMKVRHARFTRRLDQQLEDMREGYKELRDQSGELADSVSMTIKKAVGESGETISDVMESVGSLQMKVVWIEKDVKECKRLRKEADRQGLTDARGRVEGRSSSLREVRARSESLQRDVRGTSAMCRAGIISRGEWDLKVAHSIEEAQNLALDETVLSGRLSPAEITAAKGKGKVTRGPPTFGKGSSQRLVTGSLSGDPWPADHHHQEPRDLSLQ